MKLHQGKIPQEKHPSLQSFLHSVSSTLSSTLEGPQGPLVTSSVGSAHVALKILLFAEATASRGLSSKRPSHRPSLKLSFFPTGFCPRWCWAASVLISARCWVLIASRSLWCFLLCHSHTCMLSSNLKMSCFDMKQNEYQKNRSFPQKPSEIQLSQMFTSSICFSPNNRNPPVFFFTPKKRQLPGAGVWGGHGQQRSGV